MSPDKHESSRWEEICAAFDEVMQQEASAREGALARLEDATLREAVASLVQWHDESEHLLDPRRLDPARRSVLAESTSELLPRTLGRYRLLRVIGRGGMSVVYVGERVDGEYRQRVAIKLLPHSLGSEELVHRFRIERQILAGLDHPCIAKLLDGGTTDEGLPFLVMELVEGERIDRYCQRRGLSVEARLRLFLRVCAAVEHAHRHLVVHRDLKPSNILVRDDDELKLLDFGIAKLLTPEWAGEQAMATLPDGRPMTPEYASPEQLRGAAITTASDVYSLGVLLHELLTGARPPRSAERTPVGTEHAATEVLPVRPSLAVKKTDRRLAARLAGDLDVILLMALRPEPDRRYESVAELARDLERHLAGLPVRARGESVWYLGRKLIERHRWRLAGAAALLCLLGVLGWNLFRQSAEAQRQRESAADLAHFLEDIFLASDPRSTRGEPFDQRSILARGVEQIESRLADQPLVRARLLDTVARVYVQLGAYREAKELCRRSLEIRRGERRPDPELVAASLQHLAAAHARLDELEEAEPLLREARVLCNQPALRDHPGCIFVLIELGGVIQRQGRTLEAEPLLERALEQARQHLDRPKDSRVFDAPVTLAGQAARRLAVNRTAQGRRLEARVLLREALVWYREAIQAPHPYIATVLVDLGALESASGELGEAEKLLREALAMRVVLYGNEHPENAAAQAALARVLAATGREAEARALRAQALALTRRFFGENHPRTEALRRESAELLASLP